MRTAKLWLHIPLCLLILWVSPVVAQEPSDQGPDLINTLGVGARAIAMGDAYTAIADDPSATFWNPARLGEIPFLQVMVEGRNVLRVTQVTGEPLPDYWDPTNTEENGITRLPMKLSFSGFSKSIGDWEPNVGSRGGTVGVSYTLGGYFDYRSRYNLPGEEIEGENSAALFQEDRLVQNHYLTAAWGKNFLFARGPRAVEGETAEPGGVERKGRIYKVGIGVGGFAVRQTQRKRSATVVKKLGPNGVDDYTIGDTIIDDTIVPGTEVVIPPLDSSGTGYGFIVGVTGELWGYRTSQGDELLPEGGRLRLGATYRSKADIGGLITKMPDDTDFDMGDEFGREIPARITVGAAYEYTEPEESVMTSATVRAPRQLTMSAEVQYFGSANDTPFALDKRKAITNFGFGIEYIPTRQWLPIPFLRRLTYDETKLAYVEPIRLGVRTNQAGNVYGIFEDDVVVSGGLAVYYSALNGGARGNYSFSFEPTGEYFINSKQSIWTLSTNYRF
jgi:hypothetical protein